MKKYVAFLLMAVMLVSMLAGCGGAEDTNANVVNGTFTEYLVAEKVGNLNRDNFTTAEGGVFYKGDNDLWGLMTFNGAQDTGAVYAELTPIGKYFQVRTTAVSGERDFAGINSSKLVDSRGKAIVPDSAAAFEVLNERYIQVVRVEDRTVVEDEAVVSRSDSGLCFVGKSTVGNAVWYKGVWAVYDTVTDKYVPGATGSHNTYVNASGRYVSFSDTENKGIKIDETGAPLPEGAKLFDDGSYAVEGKVGEVFDGNGQRLFSYDLTSYKPYSYSNGYYVASLYADGASKYVVMDMTGKVISKEFDTYFTIYGELVHCDEQVYDLEGNVVIDGTYESVYDDKVFGQNWMLRKDDYYTIIDKSGAVFFNGAYKDEYTVWTSDFLASKKVDSDSYYYSYKDQDYTIKGYHFAPWIVKTENTNSLYDLVDAMTGKKLLEGYNDYASISRNSLAYYVYAKYNGGADVYLVVSGAQLAEVTQKKSDLFDDLSKAFADEGINVTVNKESGEIALDSSVLFGGDSAELTADGKAFLNKFIKAYTAVAFTGKYEGFISKTMVEGHTAPIEGSTYASGLPLSEERADNVKAYCLSADTGVDVSKISNSLEAVGYSNSKPVYGADGKVDLAASRRVSFRFMVNVEF